MITTVIIISFVGLFKSASLTGLLLSTEFDVLAILSTLLYKPSYFIRTKKPSRLQYKQQRNYITRSNGRIFNRNTSTTKTKLRRLNGKRLELLAVSII